MASSIGSSLKPVKPHYIFELPYKNRRKLEKILDADGKWEELGGRFIVKDEMELKLIGKAVFHNESPTDVLLERFGRGNGTIDQLFIMLYNMNHQRAMTEISAYVSLKYHHLLCSPISMDSKDIVTPTAPSKSQVHSYFSSQEPKGAFGMTSAFSKLAVDSDNINNSQGHSSVPQKLAGIQSNSRNDYDMGATRQKSSLTQNESRLDFPTKHSSPTERIPPNLSEVSQLNKGQRTLDPRAQMKLNIPVSQPHNGAIKKINREVETKAQFRQSSEELPPFIMEIPYADILKATDNFHPDRILGQGGFGIVYKADWKGNAVAVKRISPKNKTDAHFAGQISIKQSLTEMKVLYTCRIDNILPLYGVCLKGPEPCLLYQFMVNGSLEDRLLCKAKSKPLTWDQRSSIAVGTARGLNYLHTVPDKPLVHGDIKSANILLDVNMEPKIGDFGLAREGPSRDATHLKVSSVHGTQFYLPAEYLRYFQLSPKVDVFSFGIVLLEIATGLRVYNDKLQKNKHLLDLVSETKEGEIESLRDIKGGEENYEWFEAIFRLGKICSAVKKNHRPDMGEVLAKFQQSQQNIEMIRKVRKLSREMPESPVPLSPMELQLLYDYRNGPDFLRYPAGIMAPPHFVEPDTTTMNPIIPSIHPSQIREPPSLEPHFIAQMIHDHSNDRPLDSSLAATAGSLFPEGSTNQTQNSETQLSDPSSLIIPNLTDLLDNKTQSPVCPSSVFSTASSVLSSDLALSEIPGRETVYTPKMGESNISLEDDDDDDDDDEELYDDDVYDESSSSVDNEKVVLA